MMDRGKKKTLIFDSLLILTLLAVSLSAFFITRAMSKTGKFVRVYVDNVAVCDYPLSEDGVYPLNGGTNILEISDSRVRILSADCPKQVCVNQGFIRLSYEKIICAENKVMVEIRE